MIVKQVIAKRADIVRICFWIYCPFLDICIMFLHICPFLSIYCMILWNNRLNWTYTQVYLILCPKKQIYLDNRHNIVLYMSKNEIKWHILHCSLQRIGHRKMVWFLYVQRMPGISIYFTFRQVREELFYFVTKKSRIYAEAGVLQTPK